MDTGAARPAAVTALGWIFAGIAALMALAALGVLVNSWLMLEKPEVRELLAKGGGLPWLLRHYRIVAGLQLLVAAVLAAAAWQFLRRRAWARAVLEVATWLGLAYVIGFGIFWVVNWPGMTSHVEVPIGAPDVFAVFGAIMGGLVTIVFAVPCVILLRVLRSRAVREAMRG